MAVERIARILIDGASSDLSFSYLVPGEIRLEPGHRVRVPLRNRSAIGTVMSLEEAETSGLGYSIKPIIGVVSEDPFLTGGLMRLAEWISNFYLTPVESVIRSMLPKPSRGEEEKRKTAKFVELWGEVTPEILNSFSPRHRRSITSDSQVTCRKGVHSHGGSDCHEGSA